MSLSGEMRSSQVGVWYLSCSTLWWENDHQAVHCMSESVSERLVAGRWG